MYFYSLNEHFEIILNIKDMGFKSSEQKTQGTVKNEQNENFLEKTKIRL